MKNVTITYASENTVTISGYNKGVIKELQRSYNRKYAKYDPQTKTWTLELVETLDANTRKLVEWFGRQGATIISL